MSIWYPLLFFISFALCAVLLHVMAARMFFKFADRYPEIARREIPHAFSLWAHPEKFFFMFRKKLRPVLQGDAELWALRQRVKGLTIIVFVVFPAVFFAAFLTIVILTSLKIV